MSEGYYIAGPERAARVRSLFERIAPRYDLINDLQSFGLHRLWKKRLIARANLRTGVTALDVCCGTGDLAELAAAAGAQAFAVDFSGAMRSVGLERAGQARYVQADALALPWVGDAFDVVTIGYGLRNLADSRKGILELLRVLKPGGELLILDFGKPQNALWRGVYFAYLRLVVPLFGLVFCGNAAAYSYILESLLKYPAQDGVSALLRECGCGEVEVQNFLGGIMSLHRAVKPRSLGQRDDIPLVAGDFLRQ